MQFVQQNDSSSAIRVLEPLVKREPANLKALNLLGIALTIAGRIDAADVRFREALKLDPSFHPALKNLAINAFARNRFTQAQRDFEAVLKFSPGDEIAHVHLGEIRFARKDCRAPAHYEKVGAGANSRIVEVHYGRACRERKQVRAVACSRIDENDGAARRAGVALDGPRSRRCPRFIREARRSLPARAALRRRVQR